MTFVTVYPAFSQRAQMAGYSGAIVLSERGKLRHSLNRIRHELGAKLECPH
jgi:hypothetical protein